jgi:hypothetical protein
VRYQEVRNNRTHTHNRRAFKSGKATHHATTTVWPPSRSKECAIVCCTLLPISKSTRSLSQFAPCTEKMQGCTKSLDVALRTNSRYCANLQSKDQTGAAGKADHSSTATVGVNEPTPSSSRSGDGGRSSPSHGAKLGDAGNARFPRPTQGYLYVMVVLVLCKLDCTKQ